MAALRRGEIQQFPAENAEFHWGLNWGVTTVSLILRWIGDSNQYNSSPANSYAFRLRAADGLIWCD
jgi:hypothetical protein